MDPNSTGSGEYGQEGDGAAPRPRPPRESLTSDFGQHAPALARTVQLVSGDFLLTVNPVDGSEIEPCPPAERQVRPEKRTETERAEVEQAARPPVPPGPAPATLPALARQDEREKLIRLLARGRSVRLTGPAGSGRTRLLDIVAADCADLAPDGVVRLDGLRRTADDLLRDLYHAVYDAPGTAPSGTNSSPSSARSAPSSSSTTWSSAAPPSTSCSTPPPSAPSCSPPPRTSPSRPPTPASRRSPSPASTAPTASACSNAPSAGA
ncbi:hypothetical protein SHKM778_17240 [Streptomyces sp. KM77-8]|uniref:ATP-binding protein n=1 Tax=Streptomyces haneummycinicus TaxID=3074435 RepID=A0AAT9HDF4_9ACTN